MKILAGVLLSLLFITSAEASEGNTAAKECLLANGYTPQKFHTFNFSRAATCYQGWIDGDMQEEHVKIKMFLEENPWYKGKSWDWESSVNGRQDCIKYHNGTMICKTPYYGN